MHPLHCVPGAVGVVHIVLSPAARDSWSSSIQHLPPPAHSFLTLLSLQDLGMVDTVLSVATHNSGSQPISALCVCCFTSAGPGRGGHSAVGGHS